MVRYLLGAWTWILTGSLKLQTRWPAVLSVSEHHVHLCSKEEGVHMAEDILR